MAYFSKMKALGNYEQDVTWLCFYFKKLILAALSRVKVCQWGSKETQKRLLQWSRWKLVVAACPGVTADERKWKLWTLTTFLRKFSIEESRGMLSSLENVVRSMYNYYSKSPTYEPSSLELSKMRTCVRVSNHVSGVHCHVHAFSTSGCAFVYFTVQYCIEYSSTISLFQAQDVQKQV